MADKKITKKDNFNAIIEIATKLGRQDLVEFCKHEIELLDKKKSKETKSQKENSALMDKLLEDLIVIGKAVTISEFMKLSETVQKEGLSNQKISALFSKMKDVSIERTVIKGKAYFSAKE
jgi:hypothetical protein